MRLFHKAERLADERQVKRQRVRFAAALLVSKSILPENISSRLIQKIMDVQKALK
jgi:hypothetical protein